MKEIKLIRIICFVLAACILTGVTLAQNNIKPNVKAPNGFEVNSFSGNLYHQRADMKMPALGIPMEIVFSFNNTRRVRNWGLGPGWTFTYNMVYVTDSLGIYIERADGKRDLFRKTGSTYIPPPGVFDVLTEYQAGKYKLQSKEGVSYFFDNAVHKKLTQLSDRNSNVLTISYNDSLPASISDAAGRSFALNWQNGRLMKIINNCSSPAHTVQFIYDSVGNPLKVINPENDTVRYHYDHNSRIIGYTDENGYSMSIIYSANGAVEKIISCATTQLFSYTTLLRKTFVTEIVQGQRQITTYTYDTTGRIIHKDGNCCGHNTAYEYDAANNITRQTDGNNKSVRFRYDANGNIVQETDAMGNSMSFVWHPSLNKITALTDKRGNTTIYEYDANGNQTKITRPLNIIETFTYDTRGNMLSHTDGNNNATAYEYNNFGQLTKITDALNSVVQNTYDGCGNLSRVKDARNNITAYEYNALNRLTKATNALGHSTHYAYDASGNLINVKDALGRTTTYLYDGLGRRVAATSPIGVTITEEYDERGNRVKRTDGNGNSTSFTYNSRNQIMTETDALGNSKSHEYDKAGNLIALTDKRGNTTRYEYDALKRLTKITNASGSGKTYAYDAAGNKVSITDFKGNVSFMEYDALNRMIKLTDALNKTITYTYDANGSVISQKDKNDKVWTTQYNKLNRVIKNINPLGDFTEAAYDANGNRTSFKDQMGSATIYTYDAENRMLTETNALNEVTSYTYDSVGNARTISYSNGNIITNAYDAANRLTSVSDAVAFLNSYTYDANDNRLTEKDANNSITVHTYDALNRVIKETDALGNFTTMQFDANNNLVVRTDRNDNSKKFEYDKQNRCTRETDALGNSTSFEYDANGKRTRIIDAKNNITSYTFDALNRLTRETYANGTFKEYTYDANGNPKTRKDNKGIITTYTYNAVNILVQRSYPGGNNETFSYDKASRKLTANNSNASISLTYDNLGRKLSETLNGKTTAYAYNTGQRTRTITYPGGRVIKETRDQRERLISITEGGNAVAGFAYDAVDRLTVKTLGNGITQNYGYDVNNRLITMDCQPGNVLQFQYTYDKEGNRLSVIKNHRPTHSEKYLYDNIYQLTGFYTGRFTGNDLSDTTARNRYLYDGVHNRLSSVEDTLTRTYSSNNMNAYTQVITNGVPLSYAYDANSNTTSDGSNSYQYNEENRLTSISGTMQCQYDAMGRKVKTVEGPNTINYYYAGSQIIEERNGSDAVQKSFVYGTWLDDLITYAAGGNNYYTVNNPQGTVYAGFNGASAVEKYEYSGFGKTSIYNASYQNVNSSSILNRVNYQGRDYIASNFYDFRTRAYQANTGRFAQQDIMGYINGYNLYHAYFNPNDIDPYGLFIGGLSIGVAGSISFTVRIPTPATGVIVEFNLTFSGKVYECCLNDRVQPWGEVSVEASGGIVAGYRNNNRLNRDRDGVWRYRDERGRFAKRPESGKSSPSFGPQVGLIETCESGVEGTLSIVFEAGALGFSTGIEYVIYGDDPGWQEPTASFNWNLLDNILDNIEVYGRIALVGSYAIKGRVGTPIK